MNTFRQVKPAAFSLFPRRKKRACPPILLSSFAPFLAHHAPSLLTRFPRPGAEPMPRMLVAAAELQWLHQPAFEKYTPVFAADATTVYGHTPISGRGITSPALARHAICTATATHFSLAWQMISFRLSMPKQSWPTTFSRSRRMKGRCLSSPIVAGNTPTMSPQPPPMAFA